MATSLYPSERKSRRDSLYCLRRLARDIAEHAHDPAELGHDLEEMQSAATDNPDPLVRLVAVRFLTRHSFKAAHDPRKGFVD